MMESDGERLNLLGPGGRTTRQRALTRTTRKQWAANRTTVAVGPPKILSGFDDWKYRRRIVWRRLQGQLKEATSRLILWGSSFKRIEGVFGNGVSSYFRFLRWLFLLNVIIFTLLFLLVIVPQAAFTEVSLHSSHDNSSQPIPSNLTSRETFNGTCSAKYKADIDFSFVQLSLDFAQGTGWMENTVLFYGVFTNGRLSLDGSGSKDGYSYNMPLAYLTVTLAYMAISFYLIIQQTDVNFRDELVHGFNNQSKSRCYSNMTFAGWDFSLTNVHTAQIRHNSKYNEIRERLAEERLHARLISRTFRQKCRLYAARLVINVFVFGILACAAYMIYYATQESTDFKDREDYSRQPNLVRLLMEYVPSLAITVLNVVVPLLFMKIVIGEDYHPDFEVRITLARTVFLRQASLAVLLATLYYQITCEPRDDCLVGLPPDCPQLRCWETYVGQNLYRLIIMNFVVNVATVVVVDTTIRVIGTKCSHPFLKMLCEEQEFPIPKNVLDLVYAQTLCWLGAYFAPLVPAISVVSLFLLFYLKKATVLYNYTPSKRPYRSSRSHVFFMVVLLTAFILCCLPLGYCIWRVVPSRGCGPFRQDDHVYDVITEAVQSLPRFVQYILTLMTSTASLVVLLVSLILLVYYFRSTSRGRQGVIALLREQIALESRDKQFLRARLNELTVEGAAGDQVVPESPVAAGHVTVDTPPGHHQLFNVHRAPMADTESYASN